MKSPLAKFRFLWPGILLLGVLLGLGAVSGGVAATNPEPLPPGGALPLIGSYDQLLQLLGKAQGQGDNYLERNIMHMSPATLGTASPQTNAAAIVPSAVPDYSQTNLQVQGADEGDLVKTDGSYIYQVNQDRVFIIKAEPPESMKLVATLQFTDRGFTPEELYVDAENLIVIGSFNRAAPISPSSSVLIPQIYPPIPSFQTTRAIIYNLADKTQVRKVRELETEGTYLSSRKVDSTFYLLTNKYLDYYSIQQREGLTPMWRDTVRGEDYMTQNLAEIPYFPDCVSPNYLMIAAVDLDAPTAPAEVHAYLGSGDLVYASQQNLFVAVHRNDYPIETLPATGILYQPADSNTKIYRFALQPGKVQYTGAGQVPGRILNQFSMDEDAGYFRVATTSGEVWNNGQYRSSNNVYILDQNLKVCGKLENIAPGEKIYSARFAGQRAYMVTFEQVDPFFVLDIHDPLNPAVLGNLKIPGVSDYLQPYDENHIIGFGKDTVVTKGWNGQKVAFYLGMKIALFDVTNVSQPVEMSQALIGDRGTDSELLGNHKALLFSADKNLLAFPVTVMENTDKVAPDQPGSFMPEYGSFAFQGLYVYRIDLASGLQYQGRITHLSPEDYLKAGNIWYNSDKNVQRGLYIGDTLYSLSPAMIKANHLSDLAAINTLLLPAPVNDNPIVEPMAGSSSSGLPVLPNQ